MVVPFSQDRPEKWMKVPHCKNIPRTFCNLTCALSNFYVKVRARVKAVWGRFHSPWVESQFKDYYSDGECLDGRTFPQMDRPHPTAIQELYGWQRFEWAQTVTSRDHLGMNFVASVRICSPVPQLNKLASSSLGYFR